MAPCPNLHLSSTHTKVIDRAMLAYPPSSDARQQQQLQLWEKYIEFEKGNPMVAPPVPSVHTTSVFPRGSGCQRR